MQNPPPKTPELKTLLTQIQTKMSPRKILETQASIATTEIIARIQRESRLRK
jgi:hypothetical protein